MADQSGILMKLGGGIVRQQQERFFELRGRHLYYYKKSASEQPQGCIDMKDTLVSDDQKNPLGFTVSGPLLPKDYHLTSSSAADKARWVGALKGWTDSGAEKMAVACEDDGEAPPEAKKICKDCFEALALVGKGSFGKVKMVRKRDTGDIFALKEMLKAVIVRERLEEHTMNEKNLLSKINHPFIVRLHYSFQDDTKLYLVLDFLSGGELFYHMGRVGTFTEHRAKYYTAQIATALGHIHGLGTLYRDLKPENCVLDKDGNCCLTDFGLAKSCEVGQTFCGTPEYLAPEFLIGKAHGKQVDWWSLGVLFYEMMYGLPPFYSDNTNEMYELILKKPLIFDEAAEVSGAARDLCRALLERDDAERLARVEAFSAHPCYEGWDFEALLAKRMEPPFRPEAGKLHFDESFTGEDVDRESFAEVPEGGKAQHFAGFTYSESPLK